MKLEKLASLLVQDMPIAMVVLDKAASIVLHNPAFESMFGFKVSPDRKRSFGELIEPGALNDFLQQMSALVKHDQDAVELTCRQTALGAVDGKWIHIRVLPLPEDQPSGLFYAMVDDVSNNMDENLNLRREKDVAEQATRSKSSFLANMSHEIRTPIHTVTGMTELLLDTTLDDEQQEYIKQIRFSAEVLLGLINDILDFSKIEAGRLNLEIIDFDLVKTVEDAVDMQCLEAFKKGLEIIVFSDAKIPRTMRGDPVRIRQIVTNLLSNALKFTRTGEISVRLNLETIPQGSIWLQCQVKDTGIGIPPDKLNLLFQSFSQVDASMTRRFGGTGLGLSICRSLIHMMEGEIGVNSQPGQGSTFWFRLPLPLAQNKPMQWSNAPDFCSELKVLIVDDNASSRSVVRSILEPYCATISEAATGADGLADLLSASRTLAPFDIALVDLQMPGIDGWQFASEVNANKEINGTRLFLMNPPGKMGGEAKMKLLNWFDDYISKPIKRDELLAVLQRSLQDSLDLSEADPDAVLDETIHNPPPANPPRHALRILVAEDHFVNQKLFQTILSRQGHLVILAANGLEAWKTTLAEQPDLVFMDVQMPEMNGYEATQALRQAGFNNPIIAVTANALKGDQEKCLQAGMNDYLPKPFQRSDVESMIAKWDQRKGDVLQSFHVPSKPEAFHEANVNTNQGIPMAIETGIFDSKQALAVFLQDRKTLVSVLRDFCARTPLQITAIRKDLETGKSDKASLEAHTIKGSSWNLGIRQLGDAASRIENACRQNEIQQAILALPELSQAWIDFTQIVQPFLEE